MSLIIAESKSKSQNATRIEIRAKPTRVAPALLAALESSKPTRSIPQEILFPLSETCRTLYKSLSNLVNRPSSSSAWKVHEHGVPTGLFRVPLEIREQIYGLVAGHRTVLKISENYYQSRPSRRSTNDGFMSLLQTCRQMMSGSREEASTNIYSQNTFHFQNHNDFLAFAHAVNSVCLSHITSLTFDLNSILHVDGTPYDHQCPRFTVHWVDGVQAQWSRLWDITAAMENLMEVKVYLQDPGFPEWDGMQCLCLPESEILAPLWKVKRRLKVFDLHVPWVDTSSWASLRSSQPILQGAPFNLIRRGVHPLPRSRP